MPTPLAKPGVMVVEAIVRSDRRPSNLQPRVNDQVSLLTAPGLRHVRGKRFHGSIQLVHKDDLKARGEASPDDGDTLAMTFAVKVAAPARMERTWSYSYPGETERSWMA